MYTLVHEYMRSGRWKKKQKAAQDLYLITGPREISLTFPFTLATQSGYYRVSTIGSTAMNLSTRGRYAVMAMLDLAQLAAEAPNPAPLRRPVTLAQIAERQQISLSYLEQLFAQLRKAGVVESSRGPGGGYTLARPAEETFLADIILAVEEDLDLTRCGGHTNPAAPLAGQGCVGGNKCNAHNLWAALSTHMEMYLRRISLAMVLEGDVTPEALSPQLAPVQVRIVGEA